MKLLPRLPEFHENIYNGLNQGFNENVNSENTSNFSIYLKETSFQIVLIKLNESNHDETKFILKLVICNEEDILPSWAKNSDNWEKRRIKDAFNETIKTSFQKEWNEERLFLTTFIFTLPNNTIPSNIIPIKYLKTVMKNMSQEAKNIQAEVKNA